LGQNSKILKNFFLVKFPIINKDNEKSINTAKYTKDIINILASENPNRLTDFKNNGTIK